MYSMISFSIAACRSLRAPSCSNRSKNGFSSSSARLLSEITLFTDIGASFLLASSGEAAGFLLITERMRLFLSPHTQLSVIPPNLTSRRYTRSRDVENRIKARMELRTGDNRVGEQLSAWAARPADG